jgi:C-terminal processing protease CtpA/Prc
MADPHTIESIPSPKPSTPNSAYCGIGVKDSLAVSEHGLVLELVPSVNQTPAQKAGIENGDVLVAIQTPDGWYKPPSILHAQDYIRGPAGSNVTLQLLSAKSHTLFEVTLTRSFIINVQNPNAHGIEMMYDHKCDTLGSLSAPPRAQGHYAQIRNRIAG